MFYLFSSFIQELAMVIAMSPVWYNSLSVICDLSIRVRKSTFRSELVRIFTNTRQVSVSFRPFIPRSFLHPLEVKTGPILFFRCLAIEVKISGKRLFLPIIFHAFSGFSSYLHNSVDYFHPITPFHHSLKSQQLLLRVLLMQSITVVVSNCLHVKDR